MKRSISICALFLICAFLIGCGPTRKEYAINEALLIDQTRMLEDQLYRAHFQIQTLEDENAILREKLGKSKDDSDKSPVPFDGAANLPRPEQQDGYADPAQSFYPAEDMTFGANQPAATMPVAGTAPYQSQYTQQTAPYPTRYRVAQQPAQYPAGKQNYRVQPSNAQLR